MAGYSLRFVIFHYLIYRSTPLTMDISMDGFVEVSDYVFAIKFKMHVHSLLVECEFLDNNDILINFLFQQPFHLGSFRVWKILARKYKVHGGNMVLFSTFLSIVPRSVAFEKEKQHPTKVKGEPLVSWNVFDLSDGTNDDDVMVNSKSSCLCRFTTY